MQGSNRVAVIDLGSNTFHLLIVNVSVDTSVDVTAASISASTIAAHPAPFTEVFRKREYVYLSEGGISSISPAAYKRGIQALTRFKKILTKEKVTTFKCIGTAALRSAANGQQFTDEIEERFGFSVEIISGIREAELIYKGIALAGLPASPTLITDIGGGSVELILTDGAAIVHSTSKNLGISVLRARMQGAESCNQSNISALSSYLEASLNDFTSKMQAFEPKVLIGASGPFEIIEALLDIKSSAQGNTISRLSALSICNMVLRYPYLQRLKIPGMPASRADLSIESLLIVKHLIESCKSIEKVMISPYSLKEGMLSELANLD